MAAQVALRRTQAHEETKAKQLSAYFGCDDAAKAIQNQHKLTMAAAMAQLLHVS